MAAPSPVLSQTNAITLAAIEHLQSVASTSSNLQKSALDYGLKIVENPALEQKFCELLGKVVCVTAHLSQRVEQTVALRGEGPGLAWDADFAPNGPPSTDTNERTFLFPIPAANSNDVIDLKMVAIGPNNAIRWQNGNNTQVDLKTYGHIAMVKIDNVSFS